MNIKNCSLRIVESIKEFGVNKEQTTAFPLVESGSRTGIESGLVVQVARHTANQLQQVL